MNRRAKLVAACIAFEVLVIGFVLVLQLPLFVTACTAAMCVVFLISNWNVKPDRNSEG